jgi:hypothetical protein
MKLAPRNEPEAFLCQDTDHIHLRTVRCTQRTFLVVSCRWARVFCSRISRQVRRQPSTSLFASTFTTISRHRDSSLKSRVEELARCP